MGKQSVDLKAISVSTINIPEDHDESIFGNREDYGLYIVPSKGVTDPDTGETRPWVFPKDHLLIAENNDGKVQWRSKHGYIFMGNLGDVKFPNNLPKTGDVLVYNEANLKWENVPLTSVGLTAGDGLEIEAGVISVDNTVLRTAGNFTASGEFDFTATADSTSNTNGAVTFAGGVGVAKNLNALSLSDGVATLTAGKLSGLVAPTQSSDATNKQYVDNLVSGINFKEPVAAATTQNGTLATAYVPGQTIDGYTLVQNDRILLKNQTNAIENGIYIVQAAGAPLRAPDLTDGTSATGAAVYVNGGTTLNGMLFVCNSPSGSSVTGTDPLTFVQFSNSLNINAGAGLSLSGNTLNVLTDGVTTTISGNEITLVNGGVTNDFIATPNVTLTEGFGINVTVPTVALGTSTVLSIKESDVLTTSATDQVKVGTLSASKLSSDVSDKTFIQGNVVSAPLLRSCAIKECDNALFNPVFDDESFGQRIDVGNASYRLCKRYTADGNSLLVNTGSLMLSTSGSDSNIVWDGNSGNIICEIVDGVFQVYLNINQFANGQALFDDYLNSIYTGGTINFGFMFGGVERYNSGVIKFTGRKSIAVVSPPSTTNYIGFIISDINKIEPNVSGIPITSDKITFCQVVANKYAVDSSKTNISSGLIQPVGFYTGNNATVSTLNGNYFYIQTRGYCIANYLATSTGGIRKGDKLTYTSSISPAQSGVLTKANSSDTVIAISLSDVTANDSNVHKIMVSFNFE